MIAEAKTPSLVLAADHQVDDVQSVQSLLPDYQTALSAIGAHHLVLYRSVQDACRILVTLGIHQPRSVAELLRSGGVTGWFNDLGVEDLPAIFAGRLLAKLDLEDPTPLAQQAHVIVKAVVPVHDVSQLVANARNAASELSMAGMRKFWVYQAFDDPQEAMILTEVDSKTSALRWIDHPGPSTEWLSEAGIGVYPELFIGEVVQVMTIPTAS